MAFKIWHLSFGYSHPPPSWSLSTFMSYFSLNIDSTWEKNAMFGFSQSVILLYRMVSSSIYGFCKHKLFLHYLGNAIEMHVFSPQGLRVKTNLHLKKIVKKLQGQQFLKPKQALRVVLPAGNCFLLELHPAYRLCHFKLANHRITWSCTLTIQSEAQDPFCLGIKTLQDTHWVWLHTFL